MNSYWNMTKRICLVFTRDFAAVFFSILSMVITLVLMGLFLGNVNVENITDLLNQYGGTRNTVIDQENAEHLIQYWTLAGILIVNSVTVTLSVIGVMIGDMLNNRLQVFYTAPVSKNVIAFSYMSAAMFIGSIFNFLTFFIGIAFIYATGGNMLSINHILQVLVYIIMNVCIFSAMMYFIALFVQSENAWSGIATIVGTLVGFVGAIYLPLGALPVGVGNALKYEPILYGTSLMRKVFCQDILEKTFQGAPEELFMRYREHMGIDIVLHKQILSVPVQVGILFGFGCVIVLLVMIVSKYKAIKDR